MKTERIVATLSRWRSDARYSVRALYHRVTRGYTDYEWYELRSAAAQYILPRLKHLREHNHGYPIVIPCADICNMTDEESAANGKAWDEMQADMIYAMDYLADEADKDPDKERVQRGCELLGKWFQALWD